MQVCEIMREHPITLTELDTVATAARLMSDHNIGLLPVIAHASSGTLIGIVTDRDLVVRVSANERPSSTLIRDCMTKSPISVGLLDDVRYAMLLMHEQQVRGLPVVDLGNYLIGVITVSDLLQHYVAGGDVEGLLRKISKAHSPTAV